MIEEVYMHKETGSRDTERGWIASYPAEELERRNLTAQEAFRADEGKTLIKITPDYCTQSGDCSACSLSNYGKDCQNNPVM